MVQGPARPPLSRFKAPANYVGLTLDITHSNTNSTIWVVYKQNKVALQVFLFIDLTTNSTFQKVVAPKTRD